MLRYFVRRLAFAVLLVFLVSSSALWLTRLAPGDLTTERALTDTPVELARVRARYGLDRSAAAQWAAWLGRSVRFDFGESALYERPVSDLIARGAANTAILALSSLLLATVVGIPLGIFTGSRAVVVRLKPDTTYVGDWDVVAAWLVHALSLVGVSVPPLLTSLVLAWVAARTGWMPVGGMTSVDATGTGWIATIADVARHLPLPALALALPMAATIERLQSQAIGDAVREPFILAASARGISRTRLLVGHAWRVSLGPVCAFYGTALGVLLSGSFVVEYITAWPGLGRLTYEALRARDIYLVAGCAAAGAVFLAIGTLLSDVAHAVVDPRIRERLAR